MATKAAPTRPAITVDAAASPADTAPLVRLLAALLTSSDRKAETAETGEEAPHGQR